MEGGRRIGEGGGEEEGERREEERREGRGEVGWRNSPVDTYSSAFPLKSLRIRSSTVVTDKVRCRLALTSAVMQ